MFWRPEERLGDQGRRASALSTHLTLLHGAYGKCEVGYIRGYIFCKSPRGVMLRIKTRNGALKFPS